MTARVWWTSQDGQGVIDGGTFPTFQKAAASVRAFRRELLGQCQDATERAAIDAGQFDTIEETSK